jgi:hypothetical protein
MLSQVLHEIESARGPVTIRELCYKLDVDRYALEGMLQFWVRKGRIQNDTHESDNHKGGSCGTSCSGVTDCAFIAKMPKTYEITHNQLHKNR